MQYIKFRDGVEKAMKEIAEKFDLVIEVGGLKKRGQNFYFIVEGGLASSGDKSLEQMEFESHCHSFGFTPEDYRKKSIRDGKVFRLVGFNPRARKYPFLIKEDFSGKVYKTSFFK